MFVFHFLFLWLIWKWWLSIEQVCMCYTLDNKRTSASRFLWGKLYF